MGEDVMTTLRDVAGGVLVPVGFGEELRLEGTAVDRGGVVAAVEIKIDGRWRRADGHDPWTYRWTPMWPGSRLIQARAVDDSANLGRETEITIEVTAPEAP